jgi:hypothetical protein
MVSLNRVSVRADRVLAEVEELAERINEKTPG